MKPKDVHIPNQPENKFSPIFTCDSKHSGVQKCENYQITYKILLICIYVLFSLKSQIFTWEILVVLN